MNKDPLSLTAEEWFEPKNADPAGKFINKANTDTENKSKASHIYVMAQPGYEELAEALFLAYEQATVGKGNERHAGTKSFTEQPMQVLSGLFGSDVGLAFQAAKKLNEGMKLPTKERRVREYLGAIVYIAGMVVYEHNKSES